MFNVLQITHDYYNSNVYSSLFNRFDRKEGFNNTIVVPLDPNNTQNIKLDNKVINIFTMKWRRFGAFKSASDTLLEIEKNVDLNNINIVHAHFIKDGLVAYKINKKYKIPYVVSFRGSCYKSLISKIPYRPWIVRMVLRNASKIIFISHSMKQKVLNELSNDLRKHVLNNSQVIPNGIDDFWHNNCYFKERECHSPIKILSVGEISNNKNELTVAKAIEELNKSGYEYIYDIVGPIKEKNIYDKLMAYTFVNYLGKNTKEELLSIYRDEDILAVPSFSETFGLVYAEGLSQGLPIIYTKNQGFDGWTDDNAIGKSVDAHSIEDIKAAILFLSKNFSKDDIMKRVEVSKMFDWNNSSNAYLDVYKNRKETTTKNKIHREYHNNPKLHPMYKDIEYICDKYEVNGTKVKKCLDVGSGRGIFQDLIKDYTGLDSNNGLKKYYKKSFACASADNMPFKDNEFDIVLSVWALEHFENIENVLNEMIRVTKNGGHIILSPAWRVRPWTSNGYRVRPYSDFDLKGKLYKFIIPFLDLKVVRVPLILLNRMYIYFISKKYSSNMPLQYQKLNANYETFWESDSNACNSLDQYALIKWFESRGCICASHNTRLGRFLVKEKCIDIINIKNNKKLITYGDLKKGIHLRKNLEIFESLGIVCRSVNIEKLLYSDLHDYDVLYLNWFENIDKKNIIDAIKTYISKVLILKRAKHLGLKILYTKHNILPHNTKYLFLIKKLYKKCFDYADEIVCFTKYSADDIKTLYPKESYIDKINIIHPVSFVDSLPSKEDSKIKELLKPYKDNMIITLFGWIRDYKNPLLLIDVSKEFKDKKITFVINGVVPDDDLKEELIKKAKVCKNVVLNLKRIDDADLHELVQETDIFVTPYNTNNASNSGVGRLAFSYGKTAITSNIASMKVIPDGLIYKYDYIDANDHFEKLTKCINDVYNIWLDDPNTLILQGQKLQELMNDEYSFESVREEYKKLFDKMFK